MMYYDRIFNDNALAGSAISCGFRQYRVSMRTEMAYAHASARGVSVDQYLWTRLCELLTASETQSVLTPVTDLEPEWRDMLLMCPYIDMMAQNRSQHGNYQAYIFVAHKHKRPKE